MAYCTVADLVDTFGESEIESLTTRGGASTADATLIKVGRADGRAADRPDDIP